MCALLLKDVRDECLSQLSATLNLSKEVASLESDLLILSILSKQENNSLGRAQIFSRLNDHISESLRNDVLLLLEQRLQGVPIAYLLGRKEFFGIEIEVNQHVLIPRPDTERLVELALTSIRCHNGPVYLFDIATGSGAVLSAIASQLSQDEITKIRMCVASDISYQALEVAKKNIRTFVSMPHLLVQGDLCRVFDLSTLMKEPNALLLIVSNPPYLEENDPEVSLDVSKHEPHTALFSPDAGLWHCKQLVSQITDQISRNKELSPCIHMLIELGHMQLDELVCWFNFSGCTMSKHQDLAGRDRVLSLEFGNGNK